MISLPFLWKWLYINYTPLQEGEEGGITKDDLVKELLSSKEVDKEGNEHAALFAKALIGRYLCLLYKNSAQCKNRFTNPTKPNYFMLKKLDEEEREKRADTVPPFPEDLRLRILKELKEERLGRSSARNLLQLMTQPPKKKARTSEGSSQDKGAVPSDMPLESPSGEDGSNANSSTGLSPPSSPNRRALKRSASGELAGGDKRRELPASSSGAAAGHAANYRALKKQVSSPVLTQGKGGAVPPLFSQQEPWKREINDLWAKQLAMMREINTLKVELGRREAARQREILAMRQELDVMRAEIFRLRQIHGVGPLPTSLHPGKEGKEGEEGGEVVASSVDGGVAGEAEKVEETVEMDTDEQSKAAVDNLPPTEQN